MDLTPVSVHLVRSSEWKHLHSLCSSDIKRHLQKKVVLTGDGALLKLEMLNMEGNIDECTETITNMIINTASMCSNE